MKSFLNELSTVFGIEKKVICVTGAAGQLGKMLVSSLLKTGCSVLATDSDGKMLKKALIDESWNEGRTLTLACDIRNRNEIIECFNKGHERFGEINALVNNAGVSVFEPYLERAEQSIEWVMNVNLKGTILCAQEFIKYRMKQNGGGEIVNIASHYGLISPDPRIYTDCERKNSEIYGATKAGIIQMTKYFAVHAAEHGIRCNAVSPGGIRNPEHPQGEDFQQNYGYRCPMGRMAETQEIVGPILFLLSPAASYINGQNIVVDGGMTSW